MKKPWENEERNLKKMDEIFGKGSREELANALTSDKMVERIEEISKTEEQFEVWEKTRTENKRKEREDRRLNVFWRRKSNSRRISKATMRPPGLKKRWCSGGTSTTEK